MSIALNAKVETLEKRIDALEQGIGGMTRVELLAYIAQIELRIERIEARKSGPKPKDASN